MLVCVQLIDNYINVWIQCQGHLWDNLFVVYSRRLTWNEDL